jgi:hypothetical protein
MSMLRIMGYAAVVAAAALTNRAEAQIMYSGSLRYGCPSQKKRPIVSRWCFPLQVHLVERLYPRQNWRPSERS